MTVNLWIQKWLVFSSKWTVFRACYTIYTFFSLFDYCYRLNCCTFMFAFILRMFFFRPVHPKINITKVATVLRPKAITTSTMTPQWPLLPVLSHRISVAIIYLTVQPYFIKKKKTGPNWIIFSRKFITKLYLSQIN